jgi:hypothetical protein
MEGVHIPAIIVPLIADVKIVDKWGEAKWIFLKKMSH